MKKVVPQSGKVAREARECVQVPFFMYGSTVPRYPVHNDNNLRYDAFVCLHCKHCRANICLSSDLKLVG